LVIDDTPSVTTAGVMTRTQAVNIRQQRPVKAIFIDYLGLMETEERYQSEVLKIGAITRGLKLIAKQLSVPIVLLCQLNRNLESRDDKTPRLSDLRDSGAIEQDSDVVISVCRPWLYVPTPDNERECRLSILKHRDGIVGDLALEWHPETASFRDPS
jgi:replicative DNA helicase